MTWARAMGSAACDAAVRYCLEVVHGRGGASSGGGGGGGVCGGAASGAGAASDTADGAVDLALQAPLAMT